ncbi:MAG: hypothetical protein K5644_03785 [Lachnospiraceae bacterium]|nr:hypothetical protein [Lachnospiraceae bacterium]
MKNKKLSDELIRYGYVFSKSKMIATYIIMVIMSVVVGWFFHLTPGFIIALCIAVILMLPLYIKNYNYNRYEQQRFSDVNIYMEQFMYSFMKSGKILSTLNDVIQLFPEGKMSDVINKAIKHIQVTYEESDVESKALKIIEKEYNYEGLKTMHGFALSVEANGGAYTSCMQLILESRRMWADRVYEQMKIRKHQKTLVLMSILTSLLLCLVLYYMTDKMNIDVSEHMLSQVITFIVLLLDIVIFYFANKKLTVDFLEDDRKDESIMVAKYKRFQKYKEEPTKHALSMRIAGKQLTRAFEKEFPRWLLQVSLLLQSENVQVAIFKSLEDAPLLLQEELKKLILDLKKDPTGMKPYNDFLSDYNLPEVRSAMKMLFSLSEGTGASASEQIEDIIRRNQYMMDKAEKIHMEDTASGMYALFLAPQLTGGCKLLVDMILLLVIYLGKMV